MKTSLLYFAYLNSKELTTSSNRNIHTYVKGNKVNATPKKVSLKQPIKKGIPLIG